MDAETTQRDDAAGEPVVVRRSGQGWRVGAEETADLTSAMVLADLLAADLRSPAAPPSGPLRARAAPEADEAARLAVTVAQLEHALTARVRVEQAIGVLAERHRLRPRQAFDLLRNVARSGWPEGQRDRRGGGGQHVQPAAAAARGTGPQAARAAHARPLPPARRPIG